MSALWRAILAFCCTALAGGCATLHRQAAADNVIDARQHTRQGIDAAAQGQWSTAQDQFQRAVETCSTDKDARRCLAEAQWRRGEAEQAVLNMREAVRLSGGEPEQLVVLGEMEMLQGMSRLALQRANDAIFHNRQMAPAWALRADALRALGDTHAALASYHRALSCQPHFPRVQMALASIYSQQGRPQRCLATLNALARNYAPENVPAPVLFQQGLALKQLGRHRQAVETLAQAANQGLEGPDIHFHLAEAQMFAGDIANAELAINQSLALAPNYQPSLRLQAHIQQKRRRIAVLP